MTYLLAPINVDALVLKSTRDAVGPQLDISHAPWFGVGADAVPRDHNPQTPNVSSAVRNNPMTPNNVYLAPGTHLHWSLPDALTRGKVRDPKHRSYVDRSGVFFPTVPNRWLVTRQRDGKVDAAWLIESDFVHPWGQGTNSVAYPTTPQDDWIYPYARVGRCTELMQGGSAPKRGASLKKFDEALTAVGPSDPAFAALYTASHSVFGLHDEEKLDAPTTFGVLGWYGTQGSDPLRHWLNLPGTSAIDIAAVLSMNGPRIDGDDIGDVSEATKQAHIAMLAESAGWALPEGDKGNVKNCQGIMLFGQVTVDPANRGYRPKSVTGSVGVGTGPREAMATLISGLRKNPALEDKLEALGFATELKDHSLDVGSKLSEVRHTAGFTSTGRSTVWRLRPKGQDTSNPFDGQRPRQQEVNLPPDLAYLLNQLNTAQEQYEMAVDDLQAQRQQLFADWNAYMQLAYPENDDQDFAVDIDMIRDQLLPESMVLVEDASVALANLSVAVVNQHTALAVALGEHHQSLDDAEAELELSEDAGPSFWRPNDLSIAIDSDKALVPTRRHGQDHRGREDGMLECAMLDLAPLGFDATRSQIQSMMDLIENSAMKVVNGKSNAFRAIAHHDQSLDTWNAIMVEWQAVAIPALDSPVATHRAGRYKPDVLTRNFVLPEEDCELLPRKLTTSLRGRKQTLISGRSILTHHGAEILLNRLEQHLETINDDLSRLRKEKSDLKADVAKVSAAALKLLDAVERDEIFRQRDLATEDIDRHDTSIDRLARDKMDLTPILTDIRERTRLGTNKNVVTFSLGGMIDQLLMRRSEPQLPIADPLGFSADQARANQVREMLESSDHLASPDMAAPFMPLCSADITLLDGRIIDSFGQYTKWEAPQPGGSKDRLFAGKSLRLAGQDRVRIAPRSAQPGRLNFRWLSAKRDDIEANDHPAATPLCGWIVPNDFDKTVLFFDARATLLGLVDKTGTWHRAPGDPRAPAGPGLIENRHLARVATWLTSAPQGDFVQRFLSTMDSGLARIDPADHGTHGAKSLLVGRPIAIARAQVSLSLQGLPANDMSLAALALRISGQKTNDRGFGDIKVPIRLGEHNQLNDGLVGYFVDDDEAAQTNTLFAPQSAPRANRPRTDGPEIVIYDEKNKHPLTIERSFNDAGVPITMLLDPRAPVHATCGLFPTKAIRLPRAHYQASMDDLQVVFSAKPILTRPGSVQLPLPQEPGEGWSWLALEDGAWQETYARPVISLADLRRAMPGRIQLSSNGSFDPLAPGADPETDRIEAVHADLLWTRLEQFGWIETLPDGRAQRKFPVERTLGKGFDPDEVDTLLQKIQQAIEPADRHANFGPRVIVREGWLKLTPLRDTYSEELPPQKPPLVPLVPPQTS